MNRTLFAIVLSMAANAALARDAPLYKTEDCGKYTVQMDINMCTGGNYEAADAALNAVYKQVMASRTDDAARDGLKKSERSWIKFRDKNCNDEVGPQDEGGSIWNMDMNLCLEKQTDARIIVLKRMLTCTAGASVCNPH